MLPTWLTVLPFAFIGAWSLVLSFIMWDSLRRAGVPIQHRLGLLLGYVLAQCSVHGALFVVPGFMFWFTVGCIFLIGSIQRVYEWLNDQATPKLETSTS